MIQLMVWMHIAGGSLAVLGMLVAWLTKKGGLWHRRGGRLYTYAMAATLLLAVMVSVLTANIFLLLVALFSAHQIFTGWRFAKLRAGPAQQLDRAAAMAMIAVSMVMLGYGVWLLVNGDGFGIVLMVFGVIGGLPAVADYQRGADWPSGKERIVLHLTRMGGGSIATITAVVVVNVQTNLAFVGWLVPSAVITPLIVYWTRKTRGSSAQGSVSD